MSHELQTYQQSGTAGGMMVAETSSSVLAAQAKATVEARITVAYRFPRNEEDVRQRLIKECNRTSFASVAMYAKPVGGQKIRGFSIRFAEGALRLMKNIDIQSPTIYDDATKRILRVSVTDLESNLSYSQDILIEKTVERKKLKDGQKAISSRLNSYGEVVHLIEATEDELLVKQAALISKAIRTQGLRLIPGDLLDECKYWLAKTMENQDFQNPDEAKRRIFDSFAEQGVMIKHLQEYLGHEGSALTPKEMADLRDVYQALREGETTWREVMEQKNGKPPAPEGEAAGDGSIKGKSLNEALDKTKKKGSKAPEPVSDLQPVFDAMMNAKDLDALNDAYDRCHTIGRDLTKDEGTALNDFYNKRQEELGA